MLAQRNVFIDPTPVSSRNLSMDEMADVVGGGLPAVVIIACGGKLGAYTVVTVGTVVVTVVD